MKPTPPPPAATRRWAERRGRRRSGGARQAYWRAASIEAEPTLRANYLVATPGVLLAAGEVRNAAASWSRPSRARPDTPARWRSPPKSPTAPRTGPGAGPVHGARDRARRARTSSRATVGPPPRRAGSPGGGARRGGARSTASSRSEPAPVDARRALAELARARGDLPGAAQRWEEVLRFVPATGGAAELLDAPPASRHGLRRAGRVVIGPLLPGAGHEPGPGRTPALEILLGGATSSSTSPRRRSRPAGGSPACTSAGRQAGGALYRQAEILRTRLGDPTGALDAYLRSSDLDPRFVPSRLRLVDHFWSRGDLESSPISRTTSRRYQLPPENSPIWSRG